MLPTLCGHLALLAALSADPPGLPPSQVISPRPRSTQGGIPEVTSPPAARGHATSGAPPTFRFVPPLDPTVLGQRSGEPGTLTVTPEPGTAHPEATRTEEPGLFARLVLSGRLGRGGVTSPGGTTPTRRSPEASASSVARYAASSERTIRTPQ
ncbi:hypothetical protein ACN28I_37885 [Archangium gephyra]|uniref:hypothetical protein n=1 Tax=Archangium gephyra TaxID=48 RepID=UPI003B7E9005